MHVLQLNGVGCSNMNMSKNVTKGECMCES